MTVIDKIGITLFVVGMVGIVINIIRAAEYSDIKNHIYSTIPLCVGGLYFLVVFFSKIWTS